MCMLAKLLQSCPTLCDPMNCSPQGSSVRGILQERIFGDPVGDLPDPVIKPASLMPPSLASRFFATSAAWEQ